MQSKTLGPGCMASNRAGMTIKAFQLQVLSVPPHLKEQSALLLIIYIHIYIYIFNLCWNCPKQVIWKLRLRFLIWKVKWLEKLFYLTSSSSLSSEWILSLDTNWGEENPVGKSEWIIGKKLRPVLWVKGHFQWKEAVGSREPRARWGNSTSWLKQQLKAPASLPYQQRFNLC